MPAPVTLPWGFVVLLLVAAFFYAGMAGSLGSDGATDLAGRGLAMAVAALSGMVLWLSLAGLYVVSWTHGRLPGAAAIAAMFLLPLSAIAAAVATAWAEERGAWLMASPFLLPPLLAAYALWARLPALRGTLPPGPVSAVLGLAIVVLTAVPLAIGWVETEASPQRDAARAERDRQRAADDARRSREAAEADAARFAALGPDSPLADYLDHLYGEDAARAAALAGIRAVRRRNEDAVALLAAGRLSDLDQLWRFDLEAGKVCAAYADALARQAGAIDRARPAWVSAALEIERQLDNIRWLNRAGCDLDAALVPLEARIRAIADNVRLTALADAVAAARRPR